MHQSIKTMVNALTIISNGWSEEETDSKEKLKSSVSTTSHLTQVRYNCSVIDLGPNRRQSVVGRDSESDKS